MEEICLCHNHELDVLWVPRILREGLDVPYQGALLMKSEMDPKGTKVFVGFIKCTYKYKFVLVELDGFEPIQECAEQPDAQIRPWLWGCSWGNGKNNST